MQLITGDPRKCEFVKGLKIAAIFDLSYYCILCMSKCFMCLYYQVTTIMCVIYYRINFTTVYNSNVCVCTLIFRVPVKHFETIYQIKYAQTFAS